MLNIHNFKIYEHSEGLILESGEKLEHLTIAYHTYGKLSKRKDNIVWVCHALTANSDPFDWWKGLFGENDLFNPKDYFIICANILGSCYGTTGPLSINPETQKPYYHNFPFITVRDLVHSHEILRKELKIDKINILIGASMGGMQALEWAIYLKDKVDNLILLACNAKHSPWGIAFNETQRMAIEKDISWKENDEQAGLEGMKTARAIALLSYRNYNTYLTTQADENTNKIDHFKVSSYQQYQGEKLARRFNAFSYWFLSKAMDSHNIDRGRNNLKATLGLITADTLVIGIASDIIFPLEEQQQMNNYINKAKYTEITSMYGHDGFLLETEKLTTVIKDIL